MEFRKLFEPTQIGSLPLKNRIVMPAMGLGYATAEGQVSPLLLDFYAQRAQGGAALFIVMALPNRATMAVRHYPVLEEEYLDGFRRLTDAIHAGGAWAGVQLAHPGKFASSRMTGQQPVSASPIPSRLTGETPREVSIPEIHAIQDDMVAAMARAWSAGFDLVEINCYSGYLIREFLSAATNQRSDEYGGSLENRARFLLELIAQARQELGRRCALTVRLSVAEFVQGGNTLVEAKAVARMLEEAGIDAIHAHVGGHETDVPLTNVFVPPAAFTYYGQEIKRQVRLPIITVNRINDPFLAERILREGRADLVALGRPVIADPQYVNKVQEGRLEDIRPCLYCNQCFEDLFQVFAHPEAFRPIRCTMNFQVGREGPPTVEPTARPKRVLVVGGGPAGMEAALVAAQRGHQVALYEKDLHLGGQLQLSAAVPGKAEFLKPLPFYEAQFRKLGVRVHLGQEATPDLIAEESPEALILATGAEPLRPPIPGADGPNVVTAEAVLRQEADIGEKIVVVGGGATGCETALFLASLGALDAESAIFLASFGAMTPQEAFALTKRGNRQVTIVEMLPKAGLDLGMTTRWAILKELRLHGVNVITEAPVQEINAQGVVIARPRSRQKATGGPGINAGEPRLLEADTVVLAVGVRPRNGLYEAMKGKVPEVYVVGDGKKPRRAMDAIHEGALAALQV